MDPVFAPPKDNIEVEWIYKNDLKKSRSKSADYSNLMSCEDFEKLNNKILEEIELLNQ